MINSTKTSARLPKYNTAKQATLLALMSKPVSVSDLSRATGRTPNALGVALNLLQRRGLCRPSGFGEPALKGGPHPMLWVACGVSS